jgi:glycosyltransferase involved in cell wall biosynthesis
MKEISFPKLSIVTPNFNGGEFLEETILSVLGQNYPNLEYIIVDGGSIDGSIDIIKKYENRLTWWVSEPDNGMYDAIQKGFEKSTGEIMAWINSDDMYHRNAFYTVADIFSSLNQVNWLTGANTGYDEYGRTVFCSQSKTFTKFDFYNHDYKWIQQESVFWRRSLWEKAGSCLNVSLRYAGDMELWLRFIQNEELYITHALIGGFRLRKANQISLDHMDDYLKEADSEIRKVRLKTDEWRILLNYRNLLRIQSILRKLKIFRTDWIIKRYRSKYFPKTNMIEFDRYKSEFVLHV